MHSIGVRELKEHTGRVLRLVREQGAQVNITYHGRVVARMIPVTTPQPTAADMAAVWADLDQLAAEIGARWPDGADAAETVAGGRRDL